MDATKTLQFLQLINGLLSAVSPTVATAIGVGEEIIANLRAQGSDLRPFADEIARFDALVDSGLGADAAWRARHGLPPRPIPPGS